MDPRKPSTLLRNLLVLDAATCAAMGVLLTLGASLLSGLMEIPDTLLRYAGIALFPVAAFMALVARHVPTAVWGVRLIIAGNALWVMGSLYVLLGGWITPNALGAVFVGFQALAVLALLALEQTTLRRCVDSRPARAING